MACILLAGTDKTFLRMRGHFAAHDLMHAATLESAIATARSNPVDMIFCGLIFDDSKTFDLLTSLRNEPGFHKVPFVILRTEKGALSEDMIGVLQNMAQAMGAHFVDIYSLSKSKEKAEVTEILQVLVDEQLALPENCRS